MIKPLANHRSFAIGIFRQTAFFAAAVAAFAQKDNSASSIMVMIIFVLDVASWFLAELIIFTSQQNSNRDEINLRINRMIFQGILNRFRDRGAIDFDEILDESLAATNKALGDELKKSAFWYRWGALRKFLLGFGYYLWFWISYGLFYGFAGWLGSALK